MIEKRKFVRIPAFAEISYRLIKSVKTTGALSKDISRDGLRFLVNEFIPKESVLKIKIGLQRVPYSFEVMAEVKWIKKRFSNERYEIGVQFIEVPQEGFLYLEQYIQNTHSKKTRPKSISPDKLKGPAPDVFSV